MMSEWGVYTFMVAGQIVYKAGRVIGELAPEQPQVETLGPAWETKEEAARFAERLNKEEAI